MTTQDIENLVQKHTAFRSFGELKEAMLGGYIPTILPRAIKLGRELEHRGWRVWYSR